MAMADAKTVEALREALEDEYKARAPPEDAWPVRVAAPRTLTEACEAAVQAEIDNAGMYERLIAQVSDPVVRRVMRRLEEASQERHLPAFKRCLSRRASGRAGDGSEVTAEGGRTMSRGKVGEGAQ